MTLVLALALAAAPKLHVSLVKSGATAGAAAVTRELKAQLVPLEGCYDLALKSSPALKGTLALTFDVEAASITRIKASDDSVQDDTLVPCVMARLRTGRWPTQKSALTVHATFRFEQR
jgi:hypothetical protein